MDLIALIAEYGAWSWVVGGLVLLAIELIVPGGVFVWLGIAAIVTGLATLFQPMGWPIQWMLFGILALISIGAWQGYFRKRFGEGTDNPFLNQRAARQVGREGKLREALADGAGRLELDDGVWRVTGPDLPAGARVRITGYEGAVLSVEPIGDNSGS